MLSNLAFVKFTWHLPLLINKQLAPKKVQVSPIWCHLEPEYALEGCLEGLRRSMDSNRCHRASRCALEARRTAIAVPDELQESVGLGTNRALTAVRGRSAEFLKIIAQADVPRGP